MAISPAGRAFEVLGVYAFFLGITTISVALRAYCRARLVKNFALDDWLALASWVFFVCFCCFAFTGCYHGTGQHVGDIKPPSELPIGLKWWWLCEPMYVLSNMGIKASIAVMLLRLTIERTHRLIIWITIVLTEVYSAAFFFLFIFQCSPSSYFWTQWAGNKGSCINPRITVDLTYVYSALTCAGDWIFAILPIFLVYRLQMERRQKALVALILAMGAIASTATIIRIPYLHSLSSTHDFLYETTDVAIWSCVETGLGITAASGATLRPLFREWKFLNATSATRGGRRTGAYGAASTARGYVLREGTGQGHAGRGHTVGKDSWPPDVSAGVGYVSRGSTDGVRHEEFRGLGKGKIRKLTQVSVEECGYGHEMGEGDWAGSDSSERGIYGARQKVLPDIPYDGK